MYKIFALLFLPFLAFGQNNEGQVIYNETVKMNIQLPDDTPEEMKKMIPPSQTHAQILLFNAAECLYRDVTEGEEDDINLHNDDGNGGQIQIKMIRPQSNLYRDLKNDKVVESREFMGRDFLIKDDVENFKWKLAGEQKKILQYNCQKAILQDTTRKVFAWFTAEIPVDAGPAAFSNLPGLILELDIDNGARIYLASKVELPPPGKKSIEIPNKGKACTRAEYKKTVDEKMKEMNAEGGPGGMKVIIRKGN